MKKAEYVFTCDLCGAEGRSETDRRPPLWVTLDIEHPDIGRYLGEKHVCDECCLRIKKLHETL